GRQLMRHAAEDLKQRVGQRLLVWRRRGDPRSVDVIRFLHGGSIMWAARRCVNFAIRRESNTHALAAAPADGAVLEQLVHGDLAAYQPALVRIFDRGGQLLTVTLGQPILSRVAAQDRML